MTKNKFLEKYPEFKDKIINKLKKGTGGYAGKGLRSNYVEMCDIEEILDKHYIKKDIKSFTKMMDKYISKQKVKDTIDKLTKFEYGADSLYEKALMDLLMELGLE